MGRRNILPKARPRDDRGVLEPAHASSQFHHTGDGVLRAIMVLPRPLPVVGFVVGQWVFSPAWEVPCGIPDTELLPAALDVGSDYDLDSRITHATRLRVPVLNKAFPRVIAGTTGRTLQA